MSEYDHDDSADAWALLSLKDPNNSSLSPSSTSYKAANNNKSRQQQVNDGDDEEEEEEEDESPPAALAKVRGKEFEFLVKKAHTVIGRNSSTQGNVDIHLGNSNFISRAHVEIFHEKGRGFFLKCNGKNGIFVDNHFQRKNSSPCELPKK